MLLLQIREVLSTASSPITEKTKATAIIMKIVSIVIVESVASFMAIISSITPKAIAKKRILEKILKRVVGFFIELIGNRRF